MSQLNLEQKKYLLHLARQAIENYLKQGEYLKVKVKEEALQEKRGAFVTLRSKQGELRGCIGYPLPYKPLVETIIDVAVAAATQDFRFPPLSLEELPEIVIEISVLSLPHEVERPSEVKVGQHGIIISRGTARGLLLPQVPVEYNWDRETYLAHGCLKAGLEPDAWQHGAKIEVFTADVFSEEENPSPAKKAKG